MTGDGLMGSLDFVERTGMTFRQLDYWSRLDLLHPVTAARGSGSRRLFDETEVSVGRVLTALMVLLDPSDSGGVRGTVRRRLVEHVRAHGPVGMYELIPGVLLDLERLAGERSPGTDGEAPTPPASTSPSRRENRAASATRGPLTDQAAS
jgi:hypothetical protein